MPKNVFISYRSTERTQVQKLIAAVEQAGDYKVWYDQEIIGGQSWWQEILAALETADIVVLALSPAYLESDPCRKEMDYAQRLGKALIPVQIDTTLDYSQLGAKLVSRQIIHFDQDRQDTAEIRLALAAAQPSTPEADQTAPPPPISPLADVQDIIRSPRRLPVEEQQRIVDALRRHTKRVPSDSARVVELLRLLGQREDTTAEVYRDAQEIVRERASDSPEEFSSSNTPKPRTKLGEPGAIIIAAVITALATIAAVVIAANLNQTSSLSTPPANQITAENQTLGSPAISSTSIPAESGPFEVTLIFGGRDSFTVQINSESHLAGLTLETPVNSEAPEVVAESFADLVTTGFIAEAGTCLRYIHTGTEPVTPRGCSGTVLEFFLADADVFWFDEQSNQYQNIALKQDGTLIGLCPHASGGGRCKFPA